MHSAYILGSEPQCSPHPNLASDYRANDKSKADKEARNETSKGHVVFFELLLKVDRLPGLVNDDERDPLEDDSDGAIHQRIENQVPGVVVDEVDDPDIGGRGACGDDGFDDPGIAEERRGRYDSESPVLLDDDLVAKVTGGNKVGHLEREERENAAYDEDVYEDRSEDRPEFVGERPTRCLCEQI